jgi:undecaprenyl-diphosphatase
MAAQIQDTGPPPNARPSTWRAWLLREIGAVVAMLVLAGGGLAFIALADEVGEGDLHAFDAAVLYGLRQAGDPNTPLGPHWLQAGAADITAFGSGAGLTLIVVLIAGLFAAYRRWREAAILIAAPLSGVLVSHWAKAFFARERPPAALHAVEVVSPSFPSGHALLSAVVYLTLAVLVARFTERRAIKTYALAAGVVVTMLVGVSRVYLGVHWPSDVLAGWSLGAAWALAWWLGEWSFERWVVRGRRRR